jgi:hypothetical protein
MTSSLSPTRVGPDSRHSALARRLDGIGWGLFLLMTGILWLLPSNSVPPGTWLIGTGLILLALNAVRYLRGYGVNVLTTALGALAVAGGLADFGGVQLPLLAIALVAVGAVVLVRTLRGSAT